MKKAELRKLYLEKRKQLSSGVREELMIRILENFKKLDFSKVRYLHSYYPMPGRAEADTLILSDWLKKEHPEIRLVLSRTDTAGHRLLHILWTDSTPLAMNSWGITEPESGESVDPQKLEMVLVPLLAYDIRGNRVGYGKGFYDRFLAECREDVIKIGLSFFKPEVLIEDAEVHDIPLDICITPESVLRFKEGAFS